MKPIVVGIVSAAGAMAMGEQFNVALPVLGSVSKPVFYGLLGAGSSFATETIQQWLLPLIPQSDSMAKIEGALLAPAIHGALNVGILAVLDPSMLKIEGFKEPLLIGFGAEIVGQYGFSNFIAPMY